MKIPRLHLPAVRHRSRRTIGLVAVIGILLIVIAAAGIWILPAAGLIPKDIVMGGRSAVHLTMQSAGGSPLLAGPLVQPLIADYYAVQDDPDDPAAVRFLDLSRGGPDSWYWGFGDGTTSTEPSPVHRFSPPSGNTSVSLTVTREDGAKNSTSRAGIFSSAPGPATILLNTNRVGTLLKGSSLSFRVNGSHYTIAVNGKSVPAQEGSLVRLRTNRDSDGSLAIRNGEILGFSFPDATLYIDGTAAGRGSATGGSLKDPGWLATDFQFLVRPISGEIRQFSVNGNTVRAGEHNAVIRIRNFDISAGSDLTIETTPAYFSGTALEYQFLPDVIAEFNPATSVTGEVPFNVTFSDRSAGSPKAWSWDFGDGATSSERNPKHVYSEPGSYTVKLTVKSGEITDTIGKDQLVIATVPRVVADFSADPVSGPAPLRVTFTDRSSGSPSYRMWDFGDGSSTPVSTDTSTVHTYDEKGIYSVWLGIGNIFGSSDVYRQQFIVVGDPFRNPENTILLRAGRGGYLEPGSTFQFTVAGSAGTISSGGKKYDLPVGTDVRLVVVSDQYGSVDITNGKLVRFDLGNVSLYIDDRFASAGPIDGVYVPGLENVRTSLSYYMPPDSAWTQYAENGYEVLSDLENRWIRVSNVGMNENGVLSMIATENSTYLDGAAYRTEHDWIIG